MADSPARTSEFIHGGPARGVRIYRRGRADVRRVLARKRLDAEAITITAFGSQWDHRKSRLQHRSPCRMERHSLPVQPRLCGAGERQPGGGRARFGGHHVAGRTPLRDRRLLLQLHGLGARGRVEGPGRAPRPLRFANREARQGDRVGPLDGRDHHGRTGPAVPRPLRRRDPDVRRPVRRRRELEHRARQRLRVSYFARARLGAEAHGHHGPGGQPAGRAGRLQPRQGDARRRRTFGPGRRAGGSSRLVRPHQTATGAG